jgi:cell division protease FtsH
VIRAKQLKELGPPEDVEYIERERHAVAVHEACHAVIAYRTRHHMEIDIATIEKGSHYLGMVASIPPEDQFNNWRSEYEADILVSLASLAGERMFFENDSSSGVSGDLESATAVASFMEGFWGMGSTVSSYSTAKRLEVGSPGGGAGGRYKKGHDAEAEARRALADRIEDNLTELLRQVEEIIRSNRGHVLALAHALETHKTLSGEDVVAVIEGGQGPLVDGRAYGEPGFLDELEHYHQAASEAHREHSQVHVNLPPVHAVGAAPQAATAVLDRGVGFDGSTDFGFGTGTGFDGSTDFDGGTGTGFDGGTGTGFDGGTGPGLNGGTGQDGSIGQEDSDSDRGDSDSDLEDGPEPGHDPRTGL